MSRHRYGPNGEAVELFFDEVGAQKDLEAWRTVVDRYDSKARLRAADAIDEAGISAAVHSAIEKAKRDAVAKAGVSRQDLSEPEWPPMAFNKILGMVSFAAVALAQGSRLPAEYRRVVLGPFAAAGFRSVLVGMPDGVELAEG